MDIFIIYIYIPLQSRSLELPSVSTECLYRYIGHYNTCTNPRLDKSNGLLFQCRTNPGKNSQVFPLSDFDSNLNLNLMPWLLQFFTCIGQLERQWLSYSFIVKYFSKSIMPLVFSPNKSQDRVSGCRI